VRKVFGRNGDSSNRFLDGGHRVEDGDDDENVAVDGRPVSPGIDFMKLDFGRKVLG
jgi:hypothetical protein